MAGRIFLANVGANASHRFGSPVFPDGAFEFLPIPESPNLRGSHAVRYRDLRSHYDAERDLLRYMPERLRDAAAHADPEFITFTYGDNCERSPRAASLKRIEASDYLFFIARLERWDGGVPTGVYGFYLIGFLEVEAILRDVTERPPRGLLARFGRNAHVRRGLADGRLWDRFWVFAGSSTRSRRFDRAVPVTRELADRVFTAADGSPWRWGAGRTDLQVIGSYTRSCRCVIDPSLPGQRARSETFWKWVDRHNCR